MGCRKVLSTTIALTLLLMSLTACATFPAVRGGVPVPTTKLVNVEPVTFYRDFATTNGELVPQERLADRQELAAFLTKLFEDELREAGFTVVPPRDDALRMKISVVEHRSALRKWTIGFGYLKFLIEVHRNGERVADPYDFVSWATWREPEVEPLTKKNIRAVVRMFATKLLGVPLKL